VVAHSALPATVCLHVREATRTRVEPKLAHCIEPLRDPRWDAFLQAHPRASVFHSSAWLSALSRTYGYEPIAFTTTPPGQSLQNALVFCRVESWLTGRRLVSLPFSDHCEPLVDTDHDLRVLTAALEQESTREQWRYLEIRPLKPFEMAIPLHHTAVPYTFHQLDLGPDIDTLFRKCHKSSTQRKIRRAEREGLKYSEGSTEALLDHFYELFVLTRKRHKLPPPPRRWFANLMDCCGDALKIRVASHQGRPIAAMLTIRYKETLVYKYGCSDSRFNNLGSMHFLFWRAIQDAKASRLRLFDFGRTDADQQGLITFKNRWGATQSVVTYSRYSVSEQCAHVFDLTAARWKSRAAKYMLAHLPLGVLSTVGRLLYGHVG
jgi:CelD/BcsL family acetyltransferase involved in cellulose biosynthesis